MNTVVPSAWIIQEKKRREEERRRRESENDSIPISLPNDLELDDEYFEPKAPKTEPAPKSTIIIIDL
jgi:hypothetical protein